MISQVINLDNNNKYLNRLQKYVKSSSFYSDNARLGQLVIMLGLMGSTGLIVASVTVYVALRGSNFDHAFDLCSVLTMFCNFMFGVLILGCQLILRLLLNEQEDGKHFGLLAREPQELVRTINPIRAVNRNLRVVQFCYFSLWVPLVRFSAFSFYACAAIIILLPMILYDFRVTAFIYNPLVVKCIRTAEKKVLKQSSEEDAGFNPPPSRLDSTRLYKDLAGLTTECNIQMAHTFLMIPVCSSLLITIVAAEFLGVGETYRGYI